MLCIVVALYLSIDTQSFTSSLHLYVQVICKESKFLISLHISRFAHCNLYCCKISMRATISKIKLIEVDFLQCHSTKNKDVSKRIIQDLALWAIQNWISDLVVVIITTKMAHIYHTRLDYCRLQERMTTII